MRPRPCRRDRGPWSELNPFPRAWNIEAIYLVIRWVRHALYLGTSRAGDRGQERRERNGCSEIFHVDLSLLVRSIEMDVAPMNPARKCPVSAPINNESPFASHAGNAHMLTCE
jgi:hypothetical protein